MKRDRALALETRANPLSTAVTITAGTVRRKQTISGQWVQRAAVIVLIFALFHCL